MNGAGRWKAALLTLDDQIFFDVMRSCFGELKTPFNKHRLIDRLEAFLQKPSVRERIVTLIDADNAKLITAIALLDNPDTAEIAALYAGERSYLDLHHHLLNLEERLLLFREKEDGGRRLGLNPLLDEMLRERMVDPALLFPSREAAVETEKLPWLTDPLLIAFLSYIARSGELMRTGGGLKKKSEQEIETIFPDLLNRHAGGTRLFRLSTALMTIGLISENTNGFNWQYETVEAFSRLPRALRYPYLWAATLSGTKGEDPQTAARLLIRLFEVIPGKRGFTKTVLKRLIEFGGWKELPDSDRFIDSLEDLGLLIKCESGTPDEELFVKNPRLKRIFAEKSNGIPAGGTDESTGAQVAEPMIIIQPTFTLSLKPWVPLGEGIIVALCADIVRHDIYPQFEITRESVARAFAAGRSAEQTTAALEKLAGQDLSQNIAFSIRHWAEEYASIKLYRGIVLQVEDERRPLVDHSPEMKKLVKKTLAPGVYLLAPEDAPAWKKALEKIGIRIVPDIEDVSENRSELRREELHGTTDGGRQFAFENLRRMEAERQPASRIFSTHEELERREDREPGQRVDVPVEEVERIQKELFSRLDELKLKDDIRESLAERIRKKLIAFPEQISVGTIKREKTEAKGLDFLGKVRLIEQAVSGGKDFLEIVVGSVKGEPEKFLIKPLELEKHGGTLTLRGIVLPQGSEERFNVGKIGIVRKLRGSLYTG